MLSEREQIRNWLTELVDRGGRGTKKLLAKHLGIRPDALSRMLSASGETREITGVELARAAEFFQVPPPDFRAGRIAAEAQTAVPLVSWISAGRLADSDAPTPRAEKLIPMPDLDPGDYIALRVVGDSMNRYSPENSIIVVDRGDTDLHAMKPYVFAIRGEATYKLWRPGPPARLDPWSFNPENEPIFPDRRHRLYVVGRVRRTLLDL